jgi:NMD protein affecting ribosome stability and mRNA decay
MNSAILQQVFVVEYVVQHQMCEDCHRREAQDFWRALVQIRQKVWGAELEIWHCTQVRSCCATLVVVPHFDRMDQNRFKGG